MLNLLVKLLSVHAIAPEWAVVYIVVGAVIIVVMIMLFGYELHSRWVTLKKAPSTDRQNRVDGDKL